MFAPAMAVSHPRWSSFPQFDPDFFVDWEELLHKQLRQQQLYREHVQQQRTKARHLYELQFKPHCNVACSDNCMKSLSSSTLVKHHNNDCTAECGSNCAGRVVSRPNSNIHFEWSGMEPSDKQYIITAHLPDCAVPDDVSVSVDELDRLLTVTFQQKFHLEEKNVNGRIISSHSSSKFAQRTIQIPDDVDLRGISASKQQGEANNPATGASLVLLIHMPKLSAQQQKPMVKQIHIQ